MNTPSTIGTYQVERRLGGGGMAEVFLARRVGAEGFSRKVAIKRILPGATGDSAFASLFIGEARLSSTLHHPNIVSILDFDRDPTQGLFLVMELVEGRDLSQLLDAGRIPVQTVLHIVAETLRGLGHAHSPPDGENEARGLVHRDVSPHNILVSWEGDVKVSDFGIAKAKTASGASASVMIKGKPCYMSPEQANGEVLDGRSDLFAVGVMLWEMLVGQSLFGRSTLQETLAALFGAPIPSPSELRPDVPDDVSQIALKLLDRDRTKRYATAEDARRDILACAVARGDGRADLAALLVERFGGRAVDRALAPTLLSGGSSPVPPRALAQGTPAMEARSNPVATELVGKAFRWRWWALAGMGALVVIAALLAVLVISRAWRERQPAMQPSSSPVGNAGPRPPAADAPRGEAAPTRSRDAALAPATPLGGATLPRAEGDAAVRAPAKPARRPSVPAPSRGTKSQAESKASPSGIIDLRLE
jgi:serine/threonine protein kinase